jgi:type VI secretion system protein ImpM
MPEFVIGPPSGPAPHRVAVGFCGKLPARGDFVSVGLPRLFVDNWHDWMQRMLAASREMLAECWLEAWNVAPIWRFALSPGVCGPDATLGLWMASVDRVGRQFPLTFAAVAADAEIAPLVGDDGGFLAIAESVGLDALAADLEPGEIAARLTGGIPMTAGAPGIAPAFAACEGALWWNAACDSVATGAVTIATAGLPDEGVFVRMLQPGKSVGEPDVRGGPHKPSAD